MIARADVHAQRPEGAEFVIKRVPFKHGDAFDADGLDRFEGSIPKPRLSNWPMLYVLTNEDEGVAYVGQTTDVIRRMNEHAKSENKARLNRASIIYNEEFNISAVWEYEHDLIDHMNADEKFKLINGNSGNEASDYFSARVYREMFKSLWFELRELELAEHSIDEVEASEVFRFSPFKNLNTDQRLALEEIQDSIKNGLENPKPMVVSGMPGTGKTVLAVTLLKMIKDAALDPESVFYGMSVKLVEPVAGLRTTLRKSLGGVRGIRKSDIISPYDINKPKFGYRPGVDKSFDILLVDETHKLECRRNLGLKYGSFDNVSASLGLDKDCTQLDWVLSQARFPVFFYDPLQLVAPRGLSEREMRRSLGETLDDPIRLDREMRCKGGNAYLDFIRSLIDGQVGNAPSFDDFDLCFYEDFSKFEEAFERALREDELTRMVAGYAWGWASKNGAADFDFEIEGIAKKWNSTYDNWVGLGVEDALLAREVGCVHSIQGYDLSNAFVIVGPDARLGSDGSLVCDRRHYRDSNGKNGTTQSELDEYVRNIYYVLLTRGIQSTHIYITDKRLREYWRDRLPIVS